MASRPRFYTSEEVLDEIYADPGSDFNRESSSDEIEEYHDQQSSSESSENEEMIENDNQSINNKDQRANARGRGHNRGAARGNRAARRAVRRNRQQEDALLEIQWTSNDRQPRIPQFTAHQGLEVQCPNNAGAGEYLSLFLTDEFFYLLVEQNYLYAAQYKASNPNLPPNSCAS